MNVHTSKFVNILVSNYKYMGNFHPLEVVGRSSDIQHQVGKY